MQNRRCGLLDARKPPRATGGAVGRLLPGQTRGSPIDRTSDTRRSFASRFDLSPAQHTNSAGTSLLAIDEVSPAGPADQGLDRRNDPAPCVRSRRFQGCLKRVEVGTNGSFRLTIGPLEGGDDPDGTAFVPRGYCGRRLEVGCVSGAASGPSPGSGERRAWTVHSPVRWQCVLMSPAAARRTVRLTPVSASSGNRMGGRRAPGRPGFAKPAPAAAPTAVGSRPMHSDG